jgi:hypothetical protein
MTKLLLPYLCFISIISLAQPSAMEKYFADVRVGKNSVIPDAFVKTENIKSSLAQLPKYLNDSVAAVRGQAYLFAKLIGEQSQWAPTRKQTVHWLIAGARDKSTGNVGLALNYLTGFLKNDFTKSGKDSLSAMLNKEQPYLDVLVKLVGFLEMKEIESTLFNLSQESSLGRKERWACMLALTRMGNVPATDDVLNRVKRMPVSDPVVYQVFPDLIYTRAKPVFDYLLEALNNDAKNCQSASADSDANIPCAYRVMEMLAPAVVGYPLKQDVSGDIVTDNYEVALQTVRKWFKAHPDYKLVKEKF